MKKKAIILLLTSAVLTSAFAGCGCGRGNAGNNTDENGNNITGTEEMTAEETETEAVNSTENATSQLQLGNAVEIPQGWEGQLAETEAHGQLERVIADYCGIAQENYANVRYYYNYVDLNGDSKNEILALVLGENVTGMDGNALLWIDDAENGNITKDSVKQDFHHIQAPVYISNHMTDGYRDLIVSSYTGTENADTNGTAANTADTNANGTAANEADTNGAAANARTTESDTSNGNATKQGNTPADGVTQNTDNQTGTENQTTGNNQTAGNTSSGVGYRLLVWNGERYQTLEEGTVLENLDNYEGTAILTNNMENDLENDNYHFLGEALK